MYAIDLTGIQQWLVSQLEGIAEDIFVDKIPKAMPTKLNTYLLLQSGSRVMDYGAFQRMSITINVVAKDRQQGFANKTEVNRMVNDVLALFPMVNDKYSVISPIVSPSRTITGFSYASITAELTIK